VLEGMSSICWRLVLQSADTVRMSWRPVGRRTTASDGCAAVHTSVRRPVSAVGDASDRSTDRASRRSDRHAARWRCSAAASASIVQSADSGTQRRVERKKNVDIRSILERTGTQRAAEQVDPFQVEPEAERRVQNGAEGGAAQRRIVAQQQRPQPRRPLEGAGQRRHGVVRQPAVRQVHVVQRVRLPK